MLASHVIFGVYGFWLPNDPRGSWSTFVGSWNLYRYGPATKTSETRSVAGRPHNRSLRLAANSALQRPAVKFSDAQIRSVAAGFAAYASRSKHVVLSCAVLPDHVHLVLAPHRLSIKQLVIRLKGAATRQLTFDRLHPFGNSLGRPPKCFARRDWKVYLDTDEEVYRAIRYVEANPEKEGLPRQRWELVTEYARS